jgi:hypothetical protein
MMIVWMNIGCQAITIIMMIFVYGAIAIDIAVRILFVRAIILRCDRQRIHAATALCITVPLFIVAVIAGYNMTTYAYTHATSLSVYLCNNGASDTIYSNASGLCYNVIQITAMVSSLGVMMMRLAIDMLALSPTCLRRIRNHSWPHWQPHDQQGQRS